MYFNSDSWPEWGANPPPGARQYVSPLHRGPIITAQAPSVLPHDSSQCYDIIQCHVCLLNHMVGALPSEDVRMLGSGWSTPQYLEHWAQQDPVHIRALHLLPDPQEVLLTLRELLPMGRIIKICAPNSYNPLQLALQELTGIPPWWVRPPLILNYFSPKSLQLLVRRSGFDIVKQYAYCKNQFDATQLTEEQAQRLFVQQMSAFRLGDVLYAEAIRA